MYPKKGILPEIAWRSVRTVSSTPVGTLGGS
jgi:hypothetical protein